jgi:hypothetical protein
MRKHNGMRPQDIVVLLKIIAIEGQTWQMGSLANSLFISPSEISESFNRSRLAGLIDYNKKIVNRKNFMEFLEHGLRYVFPVQLGTLVKGVATAHSHPFMKEHIVSSTNYVWPYLRGDVIGLAIEPFYKNQVDAAKNDEELYKLLALVDAVRVGKVREIKYAIEELKKNIQYESSRQ